MISDKQLLLSLIATSTLITLLSLGLIYFYSHHALITAIVGMVVALCTASLSTMIYRKWLRTFRQLANYAQLIKQSDHHSHLKTNNDGGVFNEFIHALSDLGDTLKQAKLAQNSVEHIIETMFEHWPNPICFFNQQLQLHYSNPAMHEKIRGAFLRGTQAAALGFSGNLHQLKHPSFTGNWHCQTLQLSQIATPLTVFIAANIAEPLKQSQNKAQQDLVRVLAHELRNALTPVESMTDTLLMSGTDYDDLTKTVLMRINERSKHLLTFIDEYSLLNKLPAPDKQWQALPPLIQNASASVLESSAITLKGHKTIYGDTAQLMLLLTNLFKNAQEAADTHCKLSLTLYSVGDQQHLEIEDNGPGFSNFDNVLTPFYTTKKHGSGIGLPICASIANNHDGILTVKNSQNGGATVKVQWPTR